MGVGVKVGVTEPVGVGEGVGLSELLSYLKSDVAVGG